MSAPTGLAVRARDTGTPRETARNRDGGGRRKSNGISLLTRLAACGVAGARSVDGRNSGGCGCVSRNRLERLLFGRSVEAVAVSFWPNTDGSHDCYHV